MTRLCSFLLAFSFAAGVFAQDSTTKPAESAPQAASAPQADALHPHYKLETTLGDIVLRLDAEKAPITVLNFHQYVTSGFYNGTIFHRVIGDFMIQGGGFTADMGKKTDGLRSGIENEWKNGLKNEMGTIAMARLGRQPNSATSQFFINVKAKGNTALDQPRDGAAYAVFGRVIEGMDTVTAIKSVETHKHPETGMKDVPVETVVIKSVALVSEFDPAKVEEQVKAAEAEAEKAEAAAAAAKEKIAQEIEDSVAKASTTDSGLMYVILKEGTGPVPKPTDKVEVHYTGWLRDGTKFDSSRNPKPNFPDGRPFTFSLTGGVIQGWLEGVAMMKVGEKRRLIIPSDLAYGSRGRSGIPPDAMLTFDIELLAIK